MRGILTTLAALATLALSAPALAAPKPTIRQALQIAYAADPQAPCAGYVLIKWDPAVGLRGNDEEVQMYAYPDGTFGIITCTISLDPIVRGVDSANRCDIIVHGVKHLAGHEHTKTGVMAPTAGRWPACHRWDRKHRVKRHGNRFDSR